MATMSLGPANRCWFSSKSSNLVLMFSSPPTHASLPSGHSALV